MLIMKYNLLEIIINTFMSQCEGKINGENKVMQNIMRRLVSYISTHT